MFTKPADVDEGELRATISRLWGIGVRGVSYAPLGFGSHHWIASGVDNRWFVTVDDLDACLTGADDSRDAAFDRLERAFRSALCLAEAGLRFVVAPIPAGGSQILHRLADGYSVVLHPFIDGVSPDDDDGRYLTVEDRHAVVAIVAELHAATPVVEAVAVRDDLRVPLRAELLLAIEDVETAWESGPYGEQARSLLGRHARDLKRLLPRFDELAARVAAEPDRYVITHGEPGAQNVLVVNGDHLLIDWESARLAAPERDLWDLDPGDGSAIAAYEANSQSEVSADAIAAYRLWYDLFEIAGYIEFFHRPHAASADAAVSWKNLQHFLRPRERWPQLV